MPLKEGENAELASQEKQIFFAYLLSPDLLCSEALTVTI